MSIARHHAEWLSLVETSGPFLSMPVLIRAFPQGLDARDVDKNSELRQAFSEWEDSRSDRSIHYAWIKHVLCNVLEFTDEVLVEGQSIPLGLEVRMSVHGETLRPDLAVIGLKGTMDEGKPRLLIRVLPFEQQLEKPLQGKHWKASPATRMMEMLHATNVALGLITNGEHWMLVHAPRGETTGFVSWYATVWIEEAITFRAFYSLLSLKRFFGVSDNETIEALLAESAQDQQEVTDQLGFQVRRAVEVLVQTLDRLDHESGRALLEGIDEKELYDAALTVMMRLVFLFSAEERGLLLLGDALYDQYYAVSTLRDQLRELADQHGEEILERHCDAWSRLLATFRAVYGGVEHVAMRLPPYGGNLFNPERYPFLEGRKLSSRWQDTHAQPLAVDNRTVLHLLESLQMLEVKVPGGGPAEARRLSFRALDIEQIGHVYESLLDHTAVRADGPVISLIGRKYNEPEVSLDDLEALKSQGIDALVTYLKDETGRTPRALKNALLEDSDVDHQRLLIACGNDQELYERVKPFAGLVRNDTFGYPVVIRSGSVYVTAGTDRRSTGTHYTPRSLTEPIVKHTLEPLVYEGPAEGKPEEEWKLKSPREILDLKVCDMAMGSGAFLVQACRYLSERLVEAWEEVESSTPGAFLITPEGDLSTGSLTERIIPASPDERLAIACRYIADRCLYGVDKNPMAVEMAKLSLWLVTLQKDRPFSFLDHALKCGDSLIGITDIDQIRTFSLDKDQGNQRLILQFLEEEVDRAIEKRDQLEHLPSIDYSQVLEKNRLYQEAEDAMAELRCTADMLIAVEMAQGSAADRDVTRLDTQLKVVKHYHHEPLEAFQKLVRERLHSQRTFHWPLEFPEVFEQGGFDAFVCNPPFMHGKRISSTHGTNYSTYLREIVASIPGSADLVVYFLRRIFDLLAPRGMLGMVATNTVAQADSREVGLDIICKSGGTIIRAFRSLRWPGTASVFVSQLHIHRGEWSGNCYLGGISVGAINSFLDSGRAMGEPFQLASNDNKAHIGSYPYGQGFILAETDAKSLLAVNEYNSHVIFPFIGGQELYATPEGYQHRYIIDFGDMTLEEAQRYSLCLDIVERLVKPQRDLVKRKQYREQWWKFAEHQDGLYRAINHLPFCFAKARTSRTYAIYRVPTNVRFDTSVVVFASSEYHLFAVIQSSLHEIWAWFRSPTLKEDLIYSPTDCFRNFPFPSAIIHLSDAGKSYYEYRQQIIIDRQVGLTKLYNCYQDRSEHSDDIQMLRQLHIAMDQAVAEAYGWNDLDLGHDFHETRQGIRFTINESSRREVLDRLLKLNYQRYEKEVAQGLHTKGKKKGQGSKSQGELTLVD